MIIPCKILNSFIWLTDGTQTGRGGSGRNGKEVVLHTAQSSRSGPLQSDGLVL